MNNEKNYLSGIEFYRLLFTLLIVFWHSGVLPIIKHGYLAVEFFFILSGYLLYNSFKKNPDKTSIAYTIGKIKRLYIPYLLAFIYIFIFEICLLFKNNGFLALKQIFIFILKSIPEVFCIQNIGIYDGGLNSPLWYFSVLLFLGYILFSILKYNEYFLINIACPILITIIYTYIFSNSNSIELWDSKFGFYFPLLRGLAGMQIGILLFKINEYFKLNYENWYIVVINFFSILAMIFIPYIILSETYYDKFFLILCSLLLLATVHDKTFINKKINKYDWKKYSKYSFDIYLIHMIVQKIFTTFFSLTKDSSILIILVYFSLVVIIAVINHHVSNCIYKLLDRK